MKNGTLFKKCLACLVESEKTWEYRPRVDSESGQPYALALNPSYSRDGVTFEPIVSVKLPPFGVLAERLASYEFFDRILHGGHRTSGEMRRQVHCLDWLPASEYSIETLLFHCAHAIRFEQNRATTIRNLAICRDLRQRGARHKNTDASNRRAEDMQRLAMAVNPCITTGTALLREGDDPVEATVNARNNTQIVRFGCLALPGTVQPRQEYPTIALLAFSLKWLFERWPITHETDKPKRGTPPPELGPPCYDLIADVVNAVFPEYSCDELQDATSVKDNLLKRIHPEARFIRW